MLQEILTKTAERVGIDLTNQPEVELQLRNILGDAYHQLGRYGEAEGMQRRALELARSATAVGNSDVAGAFSVWRVILPARSDNEEPEGSAPRSAWPCAGHCLATNIQDVAQSLVGLGEVLAARSKYEEAERCLRQGLDLSQELPGDHRADIVGALGALGDRSLATGQSGGS